MKATRRQEVIGVDEVMVVVQQDETMDKATEDGFLWIIGNPG